MPGVSSLVRVQISVPRSSNPCNLRRVLYCKVSICIKLVKFQCTTKNDLGGSEARASMQGDKLKRSRARSILPAVSATNRLVDFQAVGTLNFQGFSRASVLHPRQSARDSLPSLPRSSLTHPSFPHFKSTYTHASTHTMPFLPPPPSSSALHPLSSTLHNFCPSPCKFVVNAP